MDNHGIAPALESAVELEALAQTWLDMAQANTLDEIEGAALNGLLALVDVEIAYTARREDRLWTISDHVGLSGDIAAVTVPDDVVPYGDALRAGETICYENPTEMGNELALKLGAVGLGSLLAVPIMKSDECVGALVIGNRNSSIFTARARALVRLFTLHLSALIVKRELNQTLSTLAEAVPCIVLRTEPSGWINWYNRRWYEFTGQTREEAAGWGWQNAHHPETLLNVMREWPAALATGQPIEIEIRLRRYDGVYHWFLALVEPVRDDKGRIVSWYGSLVDIEAQKAALERTQRVADTLQSAFLPDALPQRNGLRIDANYISAESDSLVGGDWYDAFELPGGTMGFSIGDVSGHGITASIVVGKLRQAIFTLALRHDDPADILAEVNRILRYQHPGIFVTALLGFIDRENTSMIFATAGHPTPVVAYRPNEPEPELPADGPPLGVTETLALRTQRIALQKEMVIALYTDGMTEFDRDAIAGEAKLRAVASSLVGNTSVVRPAAFINQLVFEEKPARDDAALLVFQFSAFDAHEAHIDQHFKKQWRFHASDSQSAHRARQEVAAYLRTMGDEPDQAAACELVVGELLANTVEHAPGLVDLSIEWADERISMVVRDSGPGLPNVRTTLPEDPMDEGSRGLFLVHAFASNVTIVDLPAGGTELRAVMPLNRISLDDIRRR